MGNDGKLTLIKGFNRLSGEKQAEILGMVKALTFTQLGEDKKALAFVNAVNRSYGGKGKPAGVVIKQERCSRLKEYRRRSRVSREDGAY
jgi:hypothetical protein